MAKFKVTVAEHFTWYREIEVEAESESEAFDDVLTNPDYDDTATLDDLEWAESEIINVEPVKE